MATIVPIKVVVPIPHFSSLIVPLMMFARDGKEHTTDDAANYLANNIGLSQQDRNKLLPIRNQAEFTNHVTWARARLTRAGLQEACGDGVFRNTPSGQRFLDGNPSTTGLRFLKEFQEYVKANKKKNHDTPAARNLSRLPTYLLTWKPSRSPWRSPLSGSIEDSIREIDAKGFCDLRWSCGRRKRIAVGDRVFLLRQGPDQPGIVASGKVSRAPYEDEHWDKTRVGEKSLYIMVHVDSLLDADTTAILRREDLDFGNPRGLLWNTQSSGNAIAPDVAAELERRWSAHLTKLGLEPFLLPDEVPTPNSFFEGATRQIAVSIYERNPHARRKCIEHYGVRCSVCDFDFEAAYGERGRGYIHVHHLKPLAEIREEYEINPLADLRPICPNCHAMIHRPPETISIEALRKLLKRT